MIIWLASYPKSGNTWIRSFLTNYFSESLEFNLNQLDKISKFPTPELMDQLKVNYHDLSEIISNWIPMQEFINLKNDITYLNNTFKIMNDKMSMEVFDRSARETVEVLLGSWSENYKSWKNLKKSLALKKILMDYFSEKEKLVTGKMN
jgi:hypothetical protein